MVSRRKTPILGVTGHRGLPDPEAVSRSVRAWLANGGGGVTTLLSPLAEGADRLVAREFLNLPDGVLHAVLPLPAEEYLKDFATPASQAEFSRLLAAAAEITVLPPLATRAAAYTAAGCYVVDHCDILLAIWDGQPARGSGGTGEVVAYAQKCGRHMVMIDSNDPSRVIYLD